ncbi:hypothetical protein BB560_004835 [Smittium megazygosporum]|uniref:SET domain-containing protein n=1 Tax=Smittium megazygosporum TaxID=133381 RepID=A0A2T9Z843_9FUNG|nr:hypothetical protein BB560_004835 [Smittium megazygosporum]
MKKTRRPIKKSRVPDPDLYELSKQNVYPIQTNDLIRNKNKKTISSKDVKQDSTGPLKENVPTSPKITNYKLSKNNLDLASNIKVNHLSFADQEELDFYPITESKAQSIEKAFEGIELSSLEESLGLETDIGVVADPQLKRKLIAKKDFKVGEIVMKDFTDFVTISDSCLADFCSYCLVRVGSQNGEANERKNKLRCSKCKTCYYCSPRCQKLDYPLHKPECETIFETKQSISQSIRLALRILVSCSKSFRNKYDGRETKQLGNQSQSQSEIDYRSNNMDYNKTNIFLDTLESHYNEISEREKLTFAQASMFVANAIRILRIDSYYDKGKDSARRLIELFCKIRVNGYGVFDPDFDFIGYALYPKAFLLNHDCNPNCTPVFEGRHLHMKAVRDIKSGEELTHSYINNISSLTQRRNLLLKNYNFVCKCHFCLAEEKFQQVYYNPCNSSAKLVSEFPTPNFTLKCSNTECKNEVYGNNVYNEWFLEIEKVVCILGGTSSDGNASLIQNDSSKGTTSEIFNDTDAVIGSLFTGPQVTSYFWRYCDSCKVSQGKKCVHNTDKEVKTIEIEEHQNLRYIYKYFKKSGISFKDQKYTKANVQIEKAIETAKSIFFEKGLLFYYLYVQKVAICLQTQSYNSGYQISSQIGNILCEIFRFNNKEDFKFNPKVMIPQAQSMKMEIWCLDSSVNRQQLDDIYRRCSELIYRLKKIFSPKSQTRSGLITTLDEINQILSFK